MRKYSIIAICLLMFLQLAACSAKTIKVEGFSAPESVTSDGTFFYVSNVGEKLKPMDKDGDGYISRLSADGKVLDRKFISGLNAPKGLTVLNGVLYINDIDHLKGYSVADGKQVLDLDFSAQGTSFLNGMTVIGGGKLLVSAMDTGALFEVDLSAGPAFVRLECDSDLFGPNGLSYDPETGTVYLCSFGKDHQPNGIVGKGRIDGGKFYFERTSLQTGLYDGMVYQDGNIIFSDWVDFKKEGVLIKQNVNSGELSTLDLGEKIGGPADLYLDEKGKRLWIPMMLENKVMIVNY
ncbi:hypothetical protein [Desulfovibrio sp. JC010]|uniref:hypothetical protein n=1 Tax=Desulfovibrio sp. JC010 TaxID=2593641 RepID=UPI0013D7065D|nr:hypothetical protein [Desulfovibrio sp. JC010]NDV25475.1 hypothetical protein [Desulfovibrio sp. JC010]